MAGGKHWTRSWGTGEAFKGVRLSDQEKAEALRLKARRFPPLAIARALGRSLPAVMDFLNGEAAKHARA